MTGTTIRAALVSTNSVTQGESVANLWKPLFEMGVHIDFAHRIFRWDNGGTIIRVQYIIFDTDKIRLRMFSTVTCKHNLIKNLIRM